MSTGSKPSKQSVDKKSGLFNFKSELDADLFAQYEKATSFEARVDILLLMILRTLKKK
jgi:hypothetical protein